MTVEKAVVLEVVFCCLIKDPGLVEDEELHSTNRCPLVMSWFGVEMSSGIVASEFVAIDF
jgi:hypothetical protein